jgi:twitching motility protein PilT
MDINELLAFAKKNNASDLHLTSGQSPMLRINGEMVAIRVNSLSSDDVISMIYSIMTEKHRIEYEENYEVDFAVHLSTDGRFRVNAFNTINGPAAVLRSIPTQIKSMEELKLPSILEDLTYKSKGLILVTGPTGSGKSTTLAAMINHINQNQNKHIITIEDPVEFVHKSNNSLINQRELNTSTKSFSRALKSAMREDPDIIMVGEMRDLETISLALTAAETGHLVFATLHTSSASKTIDRILDVFPEGDKAMARTMLASSLEAVVTQLLVRQADGSGRVAVHEILLANSAVRNLIRDNKIPQLYSIMQVNSKHGMKAMKASVYELMEEGIISKEDARIALNFNMDEESDGQNDPAKNRRKTGGF